MGQRLVRAKARIKLAAIPFRLPELADLPERLDDLRAEVFHRQQDAAVPVDDCQQIVKIVRDAAGQLSDRFHFLGLAQLRFKTKTFSDVFLDERLQALDVEFQLPVDAPVPGQ